MCIYDELTGVLNQVHVPPEGSKHQSRGYDTCCQSKGSLDSFLAIFFSFYNVLLFRFCRHGASLCRQSVQGSFTKSLKDASTKKSEEPFN